MKQSSSATIAFGVLVSFLAAGVTAEPDGWGLKVACGANLAHGNSDVASANLEASADRKGTPNEIHLGGAFAYGESDDDVTEENSKVDGQYNRLLSERFYLYLNGKAERDEVAMLDYRTLVGPGAGCYVVKSEQHALKIEAGASYMWEKLSYTETIDGLSGDVEETDDTTAIRIVQRYEGTVGEAKVWQGIEYLPEVDDFATYLLTAEVGIETLVTDVLSLRLVVTDRYDSEPAPGSKENDIAIRASLVFSYGN